MDDVVKEEKPEEMIYIILGVDINEHDQVLRVCRTYASAKEYCLHYLTKTDYYDLWIEKHPLL